MYNLFSILLPLFLYSISCISLGLFILYIINRKGEKDLDYSNLITLWCSAFLLGQISLSFLWFILGLTGLFNKYIIVFILVASFLFGARFIYLTLVPLLSQFRKIFINVRNDTWGWQGIALIVILISGAGIYSLGGMLAYDASTFYMTVAKSISASQIISILPRKEIEFQVVGFVGEFHYAALMTIGNQDAARLFTWPTMLAGMGMLMALCTVVGLRERGKWVSALMILTSSSIYFVLGNGKVDLFSMAYGIAAYYWILNKGMKSSSLSGLFAGTAIAAKISLIVSIIPGLAVMFIWLRLREIACLQQEIKKTFLFLIRDSIPFVIWLVLPILIFFFMRNAILFKYVPFIKENSGTMDVLLNSWKYSYGSVTPPYIYIIYPLYVIFGDWRGGQLGNLSVMVLLFYPLIFLYPHRKLMRNKLLIVLSLSGYIGLVFYVIIFPTFVEPRYYFPNLFLLIPMAARIAEYITYSPKIRKELSFGIMACLYIIGVSFLLRYSFVDFKHTMQYLRNEIPFCELQGPEKSRCKALSLVNESAKPGNRILSSFVHYYYLRSDLMQCQNREDMLNYFHKGQGDQWNVDWESIYINGYSYITIDKYHFQYQLPSIISSQSIAPPPNWVRTKLLYEDKLNIIYKLWYTNPPIDKQFDCKKITGTRWEVVNSTSH